jgi:hypothetical protein
MPRVKVCSKRPASLTCTTAYVAVTEEYRYITPAEESHGMLTANSLMQPQELARRILPGPTFKTLLDFATGVPAERWSSDVIEAAKHTGPHVSVNLSAQVDLPPKRVKTNAAKGNAPTFRGRNYCTNCRPNRSCSHQLRFTSHPPFHGRHQL